MSRWISVNERLPDGPMAKVLVLTTSNEEVRCYYHADKIKRMQPYYNCAFTHFQNAETYCFLDNVTHWKPISKPPKEQ